MNGYHSPMSYKFSYISSQGLIKSPVVLYFTAAELRKMLLFLKLVLHTLCMNIYQIRKHW